MEALRLSWPLRLVGWCFAALALLIWVKKQNEATLVNLICAFGVFAVFTSMSIYTNRDLCIAGPALVLLANINSLCTLSTILTPHLGMAFPMTATWLKRSSWLRILPWCAFALVATLHFLHVFPSSAMTIYGVSSLGLLTFFAILVTRLLRTRDALIKAQLKWVTLGAVLGFLPWVLLSASLEAVHLNPVPERYTLLFAVAVPVCISCAILRYRLLDVDRIFDWVLIHTVALGGFFLLEMSLWSWLGRHYAPQSQAKSLLLALSLSMAIFVYAPLRSWSLHLLKRATGRERPKLAEALHGLLERAQTANDPRDALEQTLLWTLHPQAIHWILPGQGHDGRLDRLQSKANGLLGYELEENEDGLDEELPAAMQAAAWVPVLIDQSAAALVLEPSGARGWNRGDLRIMHSLTHASEPLLEMRRMQRDYQKTQAALHEQRDELLREMHDGLGSQLFGAALLSNVSEKMTEVELRKRFEDVSAALSEAMDSLRTGLTVLSTPPGAFGPAVLALLLRAERVLKAAGIALKTEIDDDSVSLQLDSRSVFGLLRAMQEALTNTARHSKASSALVRLDLRGTTLNVLIEDNGIGFAPALARHGHGLTNIARRLQLLGGWASIQSLPGAGCCIELELPLRIGVL
jgi:signal transduction histidine kinase